MNHSIKGIKPMTKSELAKAYGVNIRTLTKWLTPLYKKIGKPYGRLFTPAQVKAIIQSLGKPACWT